MSYNLIVEDGPGYVHVKASGERTAENARRCLVEAYAACVRKNLACLLVEMRWSGPALDNVQLYRVISERSADGAKLRKIAYVEAAPSDDPHAPRFAETLATNRGVNVRLFRDVATAKHWLSES
jgi:hypothetical protein